ncbi:hypothetical protein [Bizionia arctica]|nr:hypothetical protein [Bizionia arctica]
MSKEQHPYIELFDYHENWKYLIIGTFPPNKEVRKNKNSVTDYFYGNKNSLWKIIQSIYPEFDFQKGSRDNLKNEMIRWQNKYSVGITDTIVSLKRSDIKSSADGDFILEWEDYNQDLKPYILNNIENIEKIFFTSSKGCNSAFETFKIIMGEEINSIPKTKLTTSLPSPSGSSNTAWFNYNNDDTLGLHPDFYNFILNKKKQHIEFFKERWSKKKIKKANKSKDALPKTPPGLVTAFKKYSYKKEFPEQRT